MNEFTLLITSAVRPTGRKVALNDESQRKHLTLLAIEKWLQIDTSLKIVICDGSDYDFSHEVKNLYPNALIECLHFKNSSEKVALFGKGYGEGEITNYALDNSTFLKNSENFAKCTSKLWVRNFNTITKHWNGKIQVEGVFKNIFRFKTIQKMHIETKFYLANKYFYKQYLSESYKDVNEIRGLSLEHCFSNSLDATELHYYMFNHPLLINGYSGSSGEYLHKNIYHYLKNAAEIQILKCRTNYIFQPL
ncbi:hypothetical protein RQP54_11905 [Curvibacter sp. APW13]|uniref:hypothetical protein n=1 Tax=Curvibacter sp. APW13 TaxID=3077236 RepID=UPI0028DEF6BC|nr:hypothetical protein [Curvibacter sp. APW13]MDT8991566.1 hypothetical protein [Curvibacter sp. APW13]